MALLLVAVMLVSALAGCGGSGSSTPASGSGSTSAGEPADANPNAGRETVNIRFAQFGNSVDDVDGMENDPIKKAIEEAKDQHSVDMERRAKIALQRAINRINVGNRL
mgnify:CR=1 FL=1